MSINTINKLRRISAALADTWAPCQLCYYGQLKHSRVAVTTRVPEREVGTYPSVLTNWTQIESSLDFPWYLQAAWSCSSTMMNLSWFLCTINTHFRVNIFRWLCFTTHVMCRDCSTWGMFSTAVTYTKPNWCKKIKQKCNFNGGTSCACRIPHFLLLCKSFYSASWQLWYGRKYIHMHEVLHE